MSMDVCAIVVKELSVHYCTLSVAEEAVVVARARDGEAEAQARLFHSVSRLALREAHAHCWNERAAENMGELYLVFLHCLATFQPERGLRFSTWFGSKAGFALLDSKRKEGKRKARFVPLVPEHEDLHAYRMPQDRADPCSDALGMLPKTATLEAVQQLFPADSPETKLIKALAGVDRTAPATQADVAREHGCTRQNVNALVRRIAMKARAELTT